MTIHKLISVLEFYDEWMAGFSGTDPRQFSETDYASAIIPRAVIRRHLRWMIRQTLVTLKTEVPLTRQAIEKAHRWLGYIQGELRAMGDFTVSQLREHSRTESSGDGQQPSIGAEVPTGSGEKGPSPSDLTEDQDDAISESLAGGQNRVGN